MKLLEFIQLPCQHPSFTFCFTQCFLFICCRWWWVWSFRAHATMNHDGKHWHRFAFLKQHLHKQNHFCWEQFWVRDSLSCTRILQWNNVGSCSDLIQSTGCWYCCSDLIKTMGFAVLFRLYIKNHGSCCCVMVLCILLSCLSIIWRWWTLSSQKIKNKNKKRTDWLSETSCFTSLATTSNSQLVMVLPLLQLFQLPNCPWSQTTELHKATTHTIQIHPHYSIHIVDTTAHYSIHRPDTTTHYSTHKSDITAN